MRLPILHHPEYVTPLPEGHRFPMRKFGRVHECLRAEVPAEEIEVLEPGPLPPGRLHPVHDRQYVEAFCRGRLTDRQLRKIGLPWSEGLVVRTLRAVAGTLATIDRALEAGLACSTAGGTHHAGHDAGAGFCVFNDLAVGAQYALTEHGLDRVLVLDCDVHQGNGTATIFDGDPRVLTVSLHCGENYPFNKATGTRDVNLEPGTGDAEYRRVLEAELRYLREEFPAPDLVLYDAGVDVHRDDRLGHLAMTTPGIRSRDRTVIDHFHHRGIPLAGVIGGGYDDDLDVLARRHTQLHRAALDVLARTPSSG